MRGEDIDRTLAQEENIVPSSGFPASVMEAIARKATEPPPMPFPWKRALPGLSWCLAVMVGLVVMGLKSHNHAASAPQAAVPSALLGGLGWIAAALAMSLVAVSLAIRLARRG